MLLYIGLNIIDSYWAGAVPKDYIRIAQGHISSRIIYGNVPERKRKQPAPFRLWDMKHPTPNMGSGDHGDGES